MNKINSAVVFKSGLIAFSLLFAGSAFAQSSAEASTGVQPTVAGQQAPAADSSAAPTRAEGETFADFVARINVEAPGKLAIAIPGLLAADNAPLMDLVRMALAPETNSSIATEILKGIAIAADAEPVRTAGQISAAALADIANVTQLIAVAREANSLPLSEIAGEGLALAANKYRANGDVISSAAIQTQATSRDVPVALSEAFLDNVLLTAAGPAAGAAAGASGGAIGNSSEGSSNGGGGSVANNGTATAQLAASRRTVSTTSVTFTTSSSPTQP